MRIPDLSTLSPWQAASRLAHLPELIFLDSALPRPGAVSLIATCPQEIVEGETAADWARLRTAIKARAGSPGFAAGAVEYEGRFRFGIYPRLIAFDHASANWRDESTLATQLAPEPPTDARPIPFQPEMEPARYEAMVRTAQEYIAAGDIYQVNLAHRFSARWSGDPAQALAFYGRLREVSPAPHAALLCTPARIIASSSPELFLQMDGREITTRPIKGTRPRAAESTADAAAEHALGASPKERAELIMITDLERNDLGQVCEYGSVRVRELLKLERFAQVHHMLSTVTGTLRPGADHIDALRACFPGGSITGAPKKRAREIIAQLEPIRRGIYTGAIGYFGFDGRSMFNIAIRTAILERTGLAHFHAGAGIVADSTPAAEYQETLWKAAGILGAANPAPI